jgi:hypothetical protein
MGPDAKPGQEPVSIVVDEAASSGGSPVLGSANLGNAAEDQRAWHEERIRRRLANEYERAGRALSEVVRTASHPAQDGRKLRRYVCNCRRTGD